MSTLRKWRAFTLIELLVVIAIVAILGTLVLGAFNGGCKKSNGSRVGIITKFSLKGNVVDSYEGEMMMGNGQAALTWEFSVPKDSTVVEKVKTAMRSGKRVEVTYKQTMWRSPKQDTSYTVIDVTPLE